MYACVYLFIYLFVAYIISGTSIKQVPETFSFHNPARPARNEKQKLEIQAIIFSKMHVIILVISGLFLHCRILIDSQKKSL